MPVDPSGQVCPQLFHEQLFVACGWLVATVNPGAPLEQTVRAVVQTTPPELVMPTRLEQSPAA